MAMDDCEAIRRLIALYGQLLDSRRFDDWGQLFTDDAVFSVWGTSYRGRDAIVRGIAGMQPEKPGKHVVLQPVIDLRGPDEARAWTDLSAFAAAEGGFAIATIGRYYDQLVREGGRWRFASRVVVMDGEPLPPGVDPVPAC
jgi:uncharacterized protein (TIGR02246 family)